MVLLFFIKTRPVRLTQGLGGVNSTLDRSAPRIVQSAYSMLKVICYALFLRV